MSVHTQFNGDYYCNLLHYSSSSSHCHSLSVYKFKHTYEDNRSRTIETGNYARVQTVQTLKNFINVTVGLFYLSLRLVDLVTTSGALNYL